MSEISGEIFYKLKTKQFYRFSGSPERWLAAIQNYTWGLKMDLLDRWQKIEVGDIFLMHSIQRSHYRNTSPEAR